MSTTKARKKSRGRREDPGPALPLKPTKAPPQDVVFRRTQRSGRLYCRVHIEEDGKRKVVVRSTKTHTTAGAQQYLRLLQRQYGKAVA